MRYFFLLLAIIIFTLSCGEQTPPSGNTEIAKDDTTPKQEETSKLLQQQQYKSYLSQRNNWLRPNRVIEKGKINPFDEALKDTSFFIFREQLLSDINRKNIVELLASVDDNIIISSDSLSGIPHFIQQWHLTTPDSIELSNIWGHLKWLLENGGYFNRAKNKFTAPYYANSKGLHSGQGCILGRGVRIRSRPGLNAQVVQKVSYDIVDILEVMEKKEMIGEEVYPWVHIRLLNGKEGYIWGKFLGFPEGDKVIFKKDQLGHWMIYSFLTRRQK